MPTILSRIDSSIHSIWFRGEWSRDWLGCENYIAPSDLGPRPLVAPHGKGLPPLDQDEVVYSAGATISGSLAFDTDARVIKTIEPLFLFSFFIPKSQKIDNHVIQALLGVNFYFTKKEVYDHAY